VRRLRIGVPLSLALHALVALGVSRFAWQAPQQIAKPAAKLTSRVVWLTAPAPAAVAVPQNETAEAGVRQPSAPDEAAIEREPEQPAPPTDQVVKPEPNETTTTQPPEPARRPSADLAEARRRAIDEIIDQRERDASYLSFAFPGTLGEERAFDESERHRRAEAGLQAPLTAFDSPSEGRAGLDERTVLGQYVRWISDECYQTHGTANPFILPIVVEVLYAAPTTTCVNTLPRRDLFANAKPRYLMDADERVAAAERTQRTERLRRPTTGAVMSLEE
jgi:hypothetical protein